MPPARPNDTHRRPPTALNARHAPQRPPWLRLVYFASALLLPHIAAAATSRPASRGHPAPAPTTTIVPITASGAHAEVSALANELLPLLQTLSSTSTAEADAAKAIEAKAQQQQQQAGAQVELAGWDGLPRRPT